MLDYMHELTIAALEEGVGIAMIQSSRKVDRNDYREKKGR